jgi:hypothetical protein
LPDVVARLTVFLGVARLAELLMERRGVSMATHERGVVLEKGARRRPSQVGRLVTGGALGARPLLLVLVAPEAAGHGRERGLPGRDDARVAFDALPAYLGHGQMLGMIHANFPGNPRRNE